MKNRQKALRRSLWVSALAIVLCCAMLVGTTFAWFTDSVSSTGNTIQAGTLDIAATVAKVEATATPAYTIEGVNGGKAFGFGEAADLEAEGTGPIISETLWEPGKTSAKLLTVTNNGNLAAKVKLSFDIAEDSGLTGALWYDFVQIKDGQAVGQFTRRPMSTLNGYADGIELPLGPANEDGSAKDAALPNSVSFILAYGMDEEAGNEYQGKSFAAAVSILATQYTYEKDGFGDDQYDVGAEFSTPVATAEELTAAISAGKDVVLEQNITLTKQLEVRDDVSIQGNGNVLKSPEGDNQRVINIVDTTEPITITLSGVDLQGPVSGTYTRGVSLYNTQPVTLIMDNCSLSANYYALNVASACSNVNVIVRNSTISGWAAFQAWSPNTNVQFENCTLIGLNDKGYNAEGWNDFATVVVNEDTTGCTLSFKNCRIEANQTTGNRQYFMSVRAANTTVNVENCTFFKDDTEISATAQALEEHISLYPEAVESFAFTIR